MSIKVTSWALNDAPVEDPVLVLVLVAMAERANDDGTTTYQSVETIARKARISVRTCQRKLRELEDAGLIRTERRGRYKLHHLDTTPLETISKRWKPKE